MAKGASRRLWIALTLFTVTLVLLFGATGSALADDKPGALRGSFTVAESKPGDHLTYTIAFIQPVDSKQGRYVDANARYVVERMPDRLLPTPDGGLVPATSFATTWTSEEFSWGFLPFFDMGASFPSDFSDEQAWQEWGEGWADMSAWDLLGGSQVHGEQWRVSHFDASGTGFAMTVPSERGSAATPAPGSTYGDTVGPHLVTVFKSVEGPCGFLSSLQGKTIDLSQPVQIAGQCPPPGSLDNQPAPQTTHGEYLASGRDEVGGRETLVLSWTGGAKAVRLWYAEDVPYPVRILTRYDSPLSDDSHDASHGRSSAAADDLFMLYEMNEFQRGTGTPIQSVPAFDSLFAPRDIHGPNDAGVTHPFPLSAAFNAARDDLVYSALRDFLTAHPNAVVVDARYHERQEDSRTDHVWSFKVDDGAAAMRVTATRGPPPYSQLLPLPVAASHIDRFSDEAVASTANPSRLPGQVPAVAAILQRWEFATSQSTDRPAWAFDWPCPADACQDDSSWIASGSVSVQVSGGPQNEQTTARYSLLGLGLDGRPLFIDESPGPYVPAGDNVPPNAYGGGWVPDWSDPDSWQEPWGFGLASVGLWTFPESETAAGVSIAAALVGLLAYWIPKGLPALGLFSRIRPDELTGHPLRAQIVELVRANPGIHFQEIVRRLDKGRGTLEHHLRKLVVGEVLTQQASKGFTCYFPKGVVGYSLMVAAPSMKSEGARKVLEAIGVSPGIAAQDVAARTGFTPSTVNYHLKRLVQSGLVTVQRAGRFLALSATPLGAQALATWSSGPVPALVTAGA